MKWLRTLIVFEAGGVISSDAWSKMHDSYLRAIASIEHPKGAGKLILRKIAPGPGGQKLRNGVGYLRSQFLDYLVKGEGWKRELLFDLAKKVTAPELKLYPEGSSYRESIDSDFGGFDFVTTAGDEKLNVATEWETGNISSSHRSLNKLAIALESGAIGAGVLIVPSRALYGHLTDRIGNIQELSGYLDMWHRLGRTIKHGLMAISVVEHDELTTDPDVPYLKAGKDGRAKEGRAKRRKRKS